MWSPFVLILLALSPPLIGGELSGLIYKDLNNVPHRPLDPGGKLASALIFYWQDCPICNSYAPELNRLHASYTNIEFYIVQVDAALTASAAGEHARAYDLRIPILLDPDHRLVKLAKANVTPEAVLFGRDGQVLYRGRIDDWYAVLGKKRSKPTQHDLRDSLEAIAAGKQVKRKETKAIGCIIE